MVRSLPPFPALTCIRPAPRSTSLTLMCHALSHPQSRPIEQACHQGTYALDLRQYGGHLIHAQHDPQAIPALDPPESCQVTNVHLKDIPVEEQQRV